MTWNIEMNFKKCRYVVVNDGESKQKVWCLFSVPEVETTQCVVWAGCGEEFEYLGVVEKSLESWYAFYTGSTDMDLFDTRKEAENALLLYWYNRPSI